MARPSEEFLLAWSSLTASDQAYGWQIIALPSAGPVEVGAGRRSPDDAEAVILKFPSVRLSSGERLPEGQGFAVERTAPAGPDQLCLALTRRTTGSMELFTAMACDVLGALDEFVLTGASETRLLRVLLGRVGAWQEFMRKGSPMPGPEAEIGLTGELLLLQALLDAGLSPTAVVEAWVGPLDGVQDFQLGTGAIEVKSTLSTTGFPARIGSLDQLDDSIRQPLFVVAMRLRQADSGRRLPEVVAAIRDALKDHPEAVRIFGDRLVATGYFDTHAAEYVRQFIILEVRVMMVQDGFPRLTFGTVPSGITRAMYDIDLDKVVTNSTSIIDALKRLGAL